MHCHLFKTLWGHEGSYTDAAILALEAGFQGLEGPASADDRERDALASALAAYELDYIAEICTAGSYVPERHATPAEHLASLEEKLHRAAPLKPRFCNVLAGCDAWPIATQIDFFRRAQALADDSGLICSFETHRSRSFFNPWTTRDILDALPALRITCDFSHWTVVCERLMDSEWDTVCYMAERAHHVHGRVGYDQGPQVPHPAAPEYAEALASHERCWQAIWQAQARRGYSVTTLTPEFGPDGYLHTQPFTQMPVADLWTLNRWMGERQRHRFSQWAARALTETIEE